MIIEKAITIISMVIWLLPLIKQYRTEYFYFFVILAIADPIMLSILFTFRLTPQVCAPFLALSLIVTLNSKKVLWFPFAVVALLITIYFVRESNSALRLIALLFHLIIFMIIISRLIDKLNTSQFLSGFLILLSIYELISVLKVLSMITDLLNGITQFYIASFFQIFFGVVFCFVSIKSNRLDFKLVKD